jgi:AraC family transcriptional regulator
VHEKKEGTIMETKIVNKPAFKAIGISYVGKNEQGEIPQMWGTFIPRINEPKRIDPSTSYGLCFSEVAGAAAGEFEYVAAVEVADDQFIPAGMVCREVPAHKYIVFTHHGKLETLGETYHYIYNTGLAQAGVQVHPSRFDMEVYTHEFAPGSDQSRLYIYVAIL